MDIFDEEIFDEVKEAQGVYSQKPTAARADLIAHATRKIITECMEKDPAFYEKFSRLIQAAIEDFRARRISDLEYLRRATKIRDDLAAQKHDDMPDAISGNDEASAYFGVVQPYILKHDLDEEKAGEVAAQISLAVQKIIDDCWKVDFWRDVNAQNAAINRIEDYLYDNVKEEFEVSLSTEYMDRIMEKTMQIARHRRQ